MDPMLEAFITESRDNLETAGKCFLELEQRPDDSELLNDLFRSMHTIKGSSGLFEIPAFTKVVHAAEDVLDSVRNGDLSLSADHIDLFLDVMDQVGIWIDNLEGSGELGDGADRVSQEYVQKLRSLLEGDIPHEQVQHPEDAGTEAGTEKTNSSPEDTLNHTDEPAPEWFSAVPDDHRRSWYQQLRESGGPLYAIEYVPDPQCFYTGEDPLLTVRSLPGVKWFRIQARQGWPSPDELDPFTCNLTFNIIADSDRETVEHHFRYVMDAVSIAEIRPDHLVFPAGVYGDKTPFEAFLQDARNLSENNDWEGLRNAIEPLISISGPDLYQVSSLRWLQLVLSEPDPQKHLVMALLTAMENGEFSRTESHSEFNVNVNEPPQDKSGHASQPVVLSDSQMETVRIAFQAQLEMLSLPCPEELLEGRIQSVRQVVTNMLSATGLEQGPIDDAADKALSVKSTKPLVEAIKDALNILQADCQDGDDQNEQQKEQLTTDTAKTENKPVARSTAVSDSVHPGQKTTAAENVATMATNEHAQKNKTLKVDQHRIDTLMDLVGEIVVAKNALPFLARKAENEYGIRNLSKEIKGQYAVINRLAEELQSAVMQIRMVPVSTVFQRFPRLVRDLSRKLDKKIRLVLEGEETEADKNVVENLADPLIHLVRNSLDHGLENAEERKNHGKPEEGKIVLRAIPLDDQVIIEVEDDGRGIDPDVIKKKAYEKGVIDEQKLDTLEDHEALQLIFSPGFSTADQVSDLSGRGVGMDVVRSVIKEAGGDVTVESEKGKGTIIRLTLPLSMAVTRVMTIEVAGQSYGIAMDNIVETVRIPRSEIQKIKQNETIVLRDRIIPLFHLRKLLKLSPDSQDSEEVAILVISLSGEEVGLVIDEFHEGLDIIQKPLEGVMAGYPWYSGAALLGDGRVLLVLNVRELLACQ